MVSPLAVSLGADINEMYPIPEEIDEFLTKNKGLFVSWKISQPAMAGTATAHSCGDRHGVLRAVMPEGFVGGLTVLSPLLTMHTSGPLPPNTCDYCQTVGHTRPACPSAPPCPICKKREHPITQCPRYKKPSARRRSPTKPGAQASKPQQPQQPTDSFNIYDGARGKPGENDWTTTVYKHNRKRHSSQSSKGNTGEPAKVTSSESHSDQGEDAPMHEQGEDTEDDADGADPQTDSPPAARQASRYDTAPNGEPTRTSEQGSPSKSRRTEVDPQRTHSHGTSGVQA